MTSIGLRKLLSKLLNINNFFHYHGRNQPIIEVAPLACVHPQRSRADPAHRAMHPDPTNAMLQPEATAGTPPAPQQPAAPETSAGDLVRVDTGAQDKPLPEKSNARTAERPAAHDGRSEAPSPRRAGPWELEAEVRKVRLDEIDGVDEEIEQFLREHDVLTEVTIQADRWSQPMIRWAVQCLHLPLWSKRNRLVHLGSGKTLTLARRLARHDEMLPATIIQAKHLSLQQKLTFVAHELLFLPALHRPGTGYPCAATALWHALDRAGVAPLKRPELRDFALATGMSIASVKPHWQGRQSR